MFSQPMLRNIEHGFISCVVILNIFLDINKSKWVMVLTNVWKMYRFITHAHLTVRILMWINWGRQWSKPVL